jgi:hypothetical protein
MAAAIGAPAKRQEIEREEGGTQGSTKAAARPRRARSRFRSAPEIARCLPSEFGCLFGTGVLGRHMRVFA